MQPVEAALRQMDPVAREIVLEHCPRGKLPSRRTEGIWVFSGLEPIWWERLAANHARHFAELVRICRRDFPTYCVLLARVAAKGGGVTVPFVFNRPQRYIWSRVVDIVAAGQGLFLVILKARQFGVSTLWMIFHQWQIWRQPDVKCMAVAHERPLAKHLIGIVRICHDHLPPILRPATRKVSEGTRGVVPMQDVEYRQFGETPWRSSINTYVADNLSPFGIQSTHILESEQSAYGNAKELNAALLPQLPSPNTEAYRRCSVVVESTPKGRNDFYELCESAKRSPGEPWHFICLEWFLNREEYSLEPPADWQMDEDDRVLQKVWSAVAMEKYGFAVSDAQMYWRHYKIHGEFEGDIDRFQREYISDEKSCFLLMSRSVFRTHLLQLEKDCDRADADAIDAWAKRGTQVSGPWIGDIVLDDPPSPFARQSFVKPTYDFVRHGGGPLSIWQPPKPEHCYVIGIDPAAGLGGDNAVLSVLDVSDGRQVAEYASNRASPEDAADIAVALGYWYNYALLMPELNTYGATTMKRIKQIWCYGNLGLEEKWDEAGFKKNKYGVYLSSWNKDVVVANLIDYVRRRYIRIASRSLLDEMSTFEYVENADGSDDYRAERGASDDRVFALAHACYAVKQSPKVLARMNEKRLVPTAQELGISNQPTYREQANKEESMGKELVAMMGKESVGYRGYPAWRVTRTWR